MATKGQYSLLCLLLSCSLLGSPSQGQSSSGFISLDCGISEGSDYRDDVSNIDYTSDASYVDTGESKKISPEVSSSNTDLDRRYLNLRSFPEGPRNCYTLRPIESGREYLVRAGFLYGNYDGLNMPPVFDLYLGVNLWTTVNASSAGGSAVIKEIIAEIHDSKISICLVNTSGGVPFVSVVEARRVPDRNYWVVKSNLSLVLFQERQNFGEDPGIIWRYPYDPYDRLWFAPARQKAWGIISTDLEITSSQNDFFYTPQLIMQTAVTTQSVSSSIDISTTLSSQWNRIYVFFHFSELQQLGKNETREMELFLNGKPWLPSLISPRYRMIDHLYREEPESEMRFDFSIRATNRSTLPPILNGMEVYNATDMSVVPTNGEDADAILSIKEVHNIRRNWQGDPCVPNSLLWQGLDCAYDGSPRIITLNLSSAELTGGIPMSIANLTNLRSLDLSKNNLNGEIPEFLAQLPLQVLILSNNKLTGTLPQILYERFMNGSLALSVDGNPDLCNDRNSCSTTTKTSKTSILVPAVATGVAVAVLLIVVVVLVRWKRSQRSKTKETGPPHLLAGDYRDQRPFTSSEIASITTQFEKEIGRGGFGAVFLGSVDQGRTLVAVKMLSKLSSQGENEFKAEVVTLMRVHHRNLVSLLGYCDEKDNLALVYEYMSQGCLHDHLRGKASHSSTLTWNLRLKIALDAAQGLEYLHSGCKPAIIHRDVKTANILLSHDFSAKISDFGLSKVFVNENSHITTNTVVGTLGYLDPEYHLTAKLTEKSDVYSFGVVLLELITSKPPIMSAGAYKTHIVQWVQPLHQRGDAGVIVDPKLQGDYDEGSLCKALETAMQCTAPTSARRPTMSQVVALLRECTATSDDFRLYSVRDTGDWFEQVPIYSEVISGPTAR